MLYIDDQLPHIQNALKLHSKIIICYINRKIYGTNKRCNDVACTICSSKIRIQTLSKSLLLVFDQINVSKIVNAHPSELLIINNKFKRLCKKYNLKKAEYDNDLLKKIFNYDWFDDKKNKFYNAYDLCNNLKIETCIYCNRLYTSTVMSVKGEMIIRPTLDHWFPQNKYPILALSFYNLIPSCTPCNSSIKHEKIFSLRSNVHPYADKGITREYELISKYDKSLNTFKVSISSQNVKILKTLKTMRISEIYENHQAELADLDLLKRKYNKSYLKKLGNMLDVKLTEKEVYRIMFGVEYEDENFYKRPLSKLKKDLLGMKIK